MKFLSRLLLLLLLTAGAIWGWEKVKSTDFYRLNLTDEPVMETSHNVVLQEITSMGRLELVRYNFRDVVEQELIRDILPNSKALLVIQGEAIGCLDLTKMTVADVAESADSLIVRLPEPELCMARVNHEKSRVYNTEFALNDEALLIDQAFKKAEGQVRQSALEMGILDQTRQNAEKILRPVLEKVSGKKVLLRYRPQADIAPAR